MTGKIEKGKEILKLYIKKLCGEQNVEKDFFCLSVSQLIKRIEPYDVISFDVFDTLLFRGVSKPTDVFIYMEAKYHFYNFSEIRIRAEKIARENANYQEVTLSDIYHVFSTESSIEEEEWIKRELETEMEICFANSYMLDVFKELKKRNKKIIAVSDMYLSAQHIQTILQRKGYQGFDHIFVSCDEKRGKYEGKIFKSISQYYLGKKIIHIGDNMTSDVTLPEKNGWDAIYYPNIHGIKKRRQLKEMSILTRSMYEAILDAYLYNGNMKQDKYFKFGFENGGIIAVGYCQWLKKIVDENHIEKVLFFARDGYILKKIFDKYFGGIATEYVLFSRFSAQQIMFERYSQSYIEQTILPRAYNDNKITIEKTFKEIDLEFLVSKLKDEGIEKDEVLSPNNVKKIVSFILKNRTIISEYFLITQNAAYEYYAPIVKSYKKILAVDLGWNGTCGIALKYLLEEKNAMEITVCNALLGAKEGQEPTVRIANRDLFVYSFASNLNRDLQKKHMGQDVDYHNLLIELLFTAPEPSFLKFGCDKHKKLCFTYKSEPLKNCEIVKRIQDGILTFVDLFMQHPIYQRYNGLDLERDSLLPILFQMDFKEGKNLLKTYKTDVLSNSN